MKDGVQRIGGRVVYLLLALTAFFAGVLAVRYSPPEAVLPAAALLSLSLVIMRERQSLSQSGLYQLYATSVIVVVALAVGLFVNPVAHGTTGYLLFAALVIALGSIMICARFDLDQRHRRKLYTFGMVAGALLVIGTFVFVPAVW